MSTKFGDFTAALRFRQAVADIAESVVDRMRPTYRYAAVQAINYTTRKVTVRFPGETSDVVVAAGSIMPSAVGQTVRIAGVGGERYVSDVIGTPYVWGADTIVAALRSQIGGFTGRNEQYRWDGSRLYWTGRLISIAHGAGPHWAPTAGWVGFRLPATGTVIPGYGGAANFTTDATPGIPISSHQALYGVPNLAAGAENATFAIVQYTSAFVVPPHWVLLGVASESDGRLMAGNGDLLDPWRIPGYLNGYVTYDGTYTPARYRKLGHVVHLQGMVRSGTTGTPIFTLPTGYRPNYRLLMRAISADVAARVDILTNGDVLHQSGGSNAWVSLDGITFPVDA